MKRGVVPRQPSRAGRQDGAKRVPPLESAAVLKAQPPKKTAAKKAPAKSAVAKAGKAPAGYNPVAPDRVHEILKRLDERYPAATCALHHHNAWELLVATILSAQCTDARVNMTTPELFKKYPTPQAFAALKPEQLEPDIKSTGFFRNKSKSIVGAAKKVTSDFGGR